MSVPDYTSQIKDICNSLGSINVMVDEDKMVEICLGGLTHRFGSFWMAICTREKPNHIEPNWLQLMLLVEENHTGVSRNTHSDG